MRKLYIFSGCSIYLSASDLQNKNIINVNVENLVISFFKKNPITAFQRFHISLQMV
jgi:hypothetical protein